ncbi:hypothetical protein niasHS_007084 [Heterodera schachtii]|uniref:Uncharacterized protein n=1 Tax=Heterodera schachtii TaxID=97005 RepID=A0ABD2JFS0_HETSC
MLKIIDKKQLPFGLMSAIARLIDGDDGPNKFDVQKYTAAVEQMHNFWRICKDMMTTDSENANLRYGNFVIYRRIQTEKVKQHLLNLTRYNMCDFVSKKIQIGIPTE